MHHPTILAAVLWSSLCAASPTRPNHAQDFSSAQKIQHHLEQVEARLRAADVRSLSPQLAAGRAGLLDALGEYRARGQFPHNHDFAAQTPYFIDQHGTACAVGQLVIASGHRALAEKIRASQNNAYLLEMNEPQLTAWVAQSGFTAEELAAIQPSYGTNKAPYGFALRHTKAGITSTVIPGVSRPGTPAGDHERYAAVYSVSKDEVWFTSNSVATVKRGDSFSTFAGVGIIAIHGTKEAGTFGLGALLYALEGGRWRSIDSSGTSLGYGGRALWVAGKNDVWLAGSKGEIVRYDGARFTSTPSGVTADIYALWGSSADNIFAAGDDGVLLRWDGTKWSTLTSPTTASLRALSGTGPNDVLAVGEKGVILAFDGAQWLAQASGTTATLNAVGKSGATALAVGNAGTVLRWSEGSWIAADPKTSAPLTGVSVGPDESWISMDASSCSSDSACAYQPSDLARGCEAIPAESLLALFALLFALRPLRARP